MVSVKRSEERQNLINRHVAVLAELIGDLKNGRLHVEDFDGDLRNRLLNVLDSREKHGAKGVMHE